jgi:transcriptional regulator with XRE-family HTH domain
MELRINQLMQKRAKAIQSQLLAARLAAEIPQEAVADALDISPRTLRNWENSYASPSLEHALGWAREMSLRFVLKDRIGRPVFSPAAPDGDVSWEKREMWRLAQPMKARREARWISQADLGLMVGTTRSTIRRWEDLAHPPRMIALIAWSDRLGFTLGLEPVVHEPRRGSDQRAPAPQK